MPNGIAVALPLALDPPAPAKAIGSTEVEQRIGKAVAGAVEAIGQGLKDFEATGHLRDVTRAAAGKCLADVRTDQAADAGPHRGLTKRLMPAPLPKPRSSRRRARHECARSLRTAGGSPSRWRLALSLDPSKAPRGRSHLCVHRSG
jgi:hypothetical protein